MAAVLMVAAFAGVIVYDDEADAVDVGAVSFVSYAGSGLTTQNTSIEATATSFKVAYTPDEASTDAAGNVLYWTTASGDRLYAGQTIDFADVKAEDVVSGVLSLTAVMKSDSDYASLCIDEITYTIPIESGKFVTTNVVYTDAKAIVDAYDADGFDITWTDKASEGYTGSPLTGDVEADEVYTMDIATSQVIWNTKGVQVPIDITDISAISIPSPPVIPYNTFLGWALSEGGEVVIAYISQTSSYYSTEVEISGTTFDATELAKDMGVLELYAIFESDLVPVSYELPDGTVYDTAEVRYGNLANKLALPAGYGAWGIVTGQDENGNDIVEAYDFATPVTNMLTLVAIPEAEIPDENVYVTFNIEGTIYGPYAINDRFSIPNTDREGYAFQGWIVQGGDGTKINSADVQSKIQAGEFTEDTVFIATYEAVEPPAPEEPAFYETTTGQVAIIIVVFALLLFGYAVYSNMGGLKDKLFGYTISKKEKKE